jgi:hypothetical protein
VVAQAQQIDKSQKPTLQQLRQQLDKQQRSLNAQKKALKRTRRQLEKLQIQSQAPAPASPATQPQAAPQQRVGKAPPNPQKEKAEQVAPVLEQPGVLTPAGHFVLEPSLQYNYSTNSRVAVLGFTVLPAIVVGLIDVRQVNSTTAIAALTGRYGITNRLEMDVKVPYVYRSDQTIGRPLDLDNTNTKAGSNQDEVFNARGHHLGDVEFGLRYQFNQGGPSFPYFIGSLRGIFPTGTSPFDIHYAKGPEAPTGFSLPTELPTGSGFYGVQPGLQIIYPSDPAVLFAGFNYLWRFKRHNESIGGTYVGTVDPGDTYQLNFGMGVSLNERSSFSIAYKHTYITKTRFGGEAPSDATDIQLSQLLFGYGFQFTPKTSLNLTVAAGLTRDTPDVGVTVRVPIRF